MPPVSASQHRVYCAWPCVIRPRSLVSVALTSPAAPGPVTDAFPRWLTSKRPTASRTAVCSLTTPDPAYSSGIDQPPNSASFAPSATCRSWRGEVCSDELGPAASGEALMAANLPQPVVAAAPARVPGTARSGDHEGVGQVDHLHTAPRRRREDEGGCRGHRCRADAEGTRGCLRWRGSRLGVRTEVRTAAV